MASEAGGTVRRLPLPDHHRYASPAARLYHLIGVQNGVRVNGRLCMLVSAMESGCRISYQTGRKTGGYGPDKKRDAYEPTVTVPPESVVEA